MRAGLRGLLVGFLLSTSGCAGAVALDVRSQPAGANVYVGPQGDQDLVGTTPTGVVIVRPGRKRVAVTLEKLGYKPVAVFLLVREGESEDEARARPHVLELKLDRR